MHACSCLPCATDRSSCHIHFLSAFGHSICSPKCLEIKSSIDVACTFILPVIQTNYHRDIDADYFDCAGGVVSTLWPVTATCYSLVLNCLPPQLFDVLLLPQPGYENLCCLRCIQPRDTNFGTNCICRVPKSKLESVSLMESLQIIM